MNGAGAARAGLLAGRRRDRPRRAATAGAAWHWLARRPLPKQKGTIELDGLRGPVRVRRDRWGVPHIEAEQPDDLWFAAGLLPRPGPALADGLLPPRRQRAALPSSPASEGLPVDRLMRTLGIRRVAEREAAALDPELRALLERFCDGVNAAADERQGAAVRDAAAAARFEPWRPVDILGLGKLLAFGLSTNWERELLRADMARDARPGAGRQARPGLPARQPGRHPGSRGSGDGPGAGRADRRGAPLDRPGHRGERLQQLGGLAASAERDRLAADRRRPAPAAEHAGHLVPGRPHPRRPLRPRRLAAGHAGRLHGPEQRRLLDLHQRDGRRPGPLRRAGRGRPLPVRGRVAAARGRARGDRGQGARRARGPRRPRSPTTARSSTRRSAPTTPSRWPCAGSRSTSRPPSPACSSCTRSTPARSWSPRSRATPRPPRT